MHYWNQLNFDGLTSIGATFTSDEDLALFGQYCLLREKGLRKSATQAAASFAAHLKSLPLVSQREIADRLVQLQRAYPGVHQLLPHPIKTGLLDILRLWCDDDPKSVIPRVDLGFLSGDIGHIEAVIRQQPNEQVALIKLAEFHLNNVEFQTHHLSESRLIGTIDEAKESLRKAEAFIKSVENLSQSTALKNELAHHRLLISEWSVYCSNLCAEPFIEWSRARGNTFDFPSIVYYKK